MIKNDMNPSEPMWGLTMHLQWRTHKSDISLISDPGQMILINLITIPDVAPPPHQPPPYNKQEEHCSALACHLLSHMKNLHFTSRAEVAEWCRKNIKVEIN
jgi:hypothetical protein